MVTERKDGTVAKNLMGKTRKADEPYLTLRDRYGWTTKVLKSWQADETKPSARWFVLVTSPMTGPRGDMGDSYVKDVLTGMPEVVQFDPAIIEQVRPVLEEADITV